MIGRTLGRYNIVEQLGEGGYGTVYRADDPRLGRPVAIKVLNAQSVADERALARFRQEARALSRLLHPNIATLFDFDSQDGLEYLVLEFVDGETLARALTHGPLPEGRARAIGVEIADPLEVAHEEGVVHRDLKPGNIMLTPRGRAKVLDFGLARLLQSTDGGAAQPTAATGAIAGTLQYMAPEQVLGDTIDQRTDIYALGVVLYEMTTGLLPYTAGDPARLVYQIAHSDPVPLQQTRPDLSKSFCDIVARCLEKEPAHRFATVHALADALRSTEQLPDVSSGLHSVPRIASIAVLPLENRSGDPEQEFFADGMTDALIADLAQIAALRVISRSSSMRFKGARRPVSEIARELNVEAVVEGSVLRQGNRVRITAQLVDARRDATLWGQSYDGDISDILTLQRDVARAIAEGIRVKITPAEQRRLEVRSQVNPAAHVAYLRGRFAWNRWDTKSLHESIALYNEALAIDPTYARAWSGLADSYCVLGNTGALPPGDAYPKARQAAKQGLELDDMLAELHAALAYVHRFHDWDWPAAEREFLRAIDLNPGYARARATYAQFLAGMGRHDEGIGQAERSLEMDPLSLIVHTAAGDVLFYARRYERAVHYYRKAIEMDATFGPAHTDLARTLDLMGRSDEALQEFLQGSTTEGRPNPSPGLATFLYRSGRRDEATTMVEQLIARAGEKYVSPYGIASFYAVAGENEHALHWLEQAFQIRDGTLVWLKVHPRLDGLRQEPRFRELLGKMRLT